MASTFFEEIKESHHNHHHRAGRSADKRRCCGFNATTTATTTIRQTTKTKRANILLTFVIVLIILAPTQRPVGVMRGARGGVTLVSAYLENLGQISSVMSEFVEALLEKVSFLAEIIIDSSMAEQCELSCPSESAVDESTLNKTSMEMEVAPATISSDSKSEINQNKLATGRYNKRSWPVKAEREFDANEFTNVALFIDSLKQKLQIKRQVRRQSVSNGAETSACRLFNLIDVSRQDLPVVEMESCCRQFDDCYGNCAKEKLACDAEFQLCFKSLCRNKFDFRNESLVYHYDRNHQRDLNGQEDLNLADELEELEQTGANEGDSITTTKQPTAKQVKRVKDKYKACKLASKVLIIGNLAFGCQAYKEAQRAVCCRRTS